MTYARAKRFYAFSLTYCWADENAEIFLAPLAELMSYTAYEDAANVAINFGDDSISVVAKSDLPVGSKLHSFVGELGTAEFLWKWGVVDHQPTPDCEKGCAADVLQLEPETVFMSCLGEENLEDNPLAESKIELLEELGLLVDLYEIEKDGQIPNDLLMTVKVLFMDEEEFTLYAESMAQAGFLSSFDDEDDDEEDDLASIEEVESGDEAEVPSKPTEKSAKVSAKADKLSAVEIDSREEEDDEDDEPEDGEEIPEIENETAVFESLISILQKKLDAAVECTAEVDWKKSGLLRKPALCCSYLQQVEQDILHKSIENCKQRLANAIASKEAAKEAAAQEILAKEASKGAAKPAKTEKKRPLPADSKPSPKETPKEAKKSPKNTKPLSNKPSPKSAPKEVKKSPQATKKRSLPPSNKPSPKKTKK